MAKTLLIDCHFLGHRARFIHGELITRSGVPSGVIFGFLDQIKTLMYAMETTDIVFCWDSFHSIRKTMSSEYKNKKGKPLSPVEIQSLKVAKDQFKKLRRSLLPDMGFVNNFIQKGYEADDVMASIVNSYKNKEFVIASADQDLYQLLNDHTSMYDMKKKILYTEASFEKEFGIPINKWPQVKAIAGCSSDNVIGIERVGEKTACSYLRGELKSHTKAYAKIEAQQEEMLQRNMPLVKLPLSGINKFIIRKNKLNFEHFLDVCYAYEFESFINGPIIEEWRTIFND